MFYEIRSLSGSAGDLRSLLSISDAAVKVMRFVSGDAWDFDRILVFGSIAGFLGMEGLGCAQYLQT